MLPERHRTLLLILTAIPLACIALSGGAQAADGVNVPINMARVIRLAGPVATVIIGNPGIADVTVQDARTLVLTGKSYGATNLIALDASGSALADTTIEVVAGDSGFVTVFAGLRRGTLRCAPGCEEIVMVGDDPEFTTRAKGSADALANLARGQ